MVQRDQPHIFDRRVIAAVSSKADGNMSFHAGVGEEEEIIENRRRWLQKLDIQLPQSVVMRVNDPQRWDIIFDATARDLQKGTTSLEDAVVTDAIVTDEPGLCLVLLTGDCVPIILHDHRGVVALVHAGWQSTNVRLAEKTVHHMQQKYGSNPATMKAYIGPSIKKDSYLLRDVSQASDPQWQPYVAARGDHCAIDLPGFNISQLRNAGLAQENIELDGVDTAKSSDYFSHYRAIRSGDGADDGRFATICMLRK